ncbi:putative polyketide synthase [Xylariaceae sp. AK1471]|nr:putative polyketide synthase [Xylariaceae sp. AK1471]
MSPVNKYEGVNEPIAVVGSGCRFPGGASTPSKLWEILKEPRDFLTKVPSERFNVDGFYHEDGAHHGRTNARHAYMLNEDPYAFDASFFNINPHEAEAIDPQHRLLLETVYESLSTAGLRVEDLHGSSTAVYVGMMQHDFADITNYDLDAIPTYAATGTSACILSNRVSYFFDWHGPSMTIDTACSSSLVAVDQAVQQLRSGSSKVAVAAGANLILGPLPFVVESKLNMLSPTGRSRMWDVGADGYARGEGVAAVVMKTLSQALKDGDPIECIIRETGVNQDGKTAGITMPSHSAQEALIRDTYSRAGLSLSDANNRCQYFEAHGTGTQAGDPQEAEAISSAFFGPRKREASEDPLYVGSIKTIIGHTEGTAGIAGLMKASLAIQKGVIPPNLLFNSLNPKVAPFYKDLDLVTKPIPWPTVPSGQPRRASVNSFGFGGTNAHVIIENYQPTENKTTNEETLSCLIPLSLSAATEQSLVVLMEDLARYLETEPDVHLRELVWTLLTKRSALPVRRALAGQTVESVLAGLKKEISSVQSSPSSFVVSEFKGKPSVLGIFTGQGAQWPAMGKVLISTLPYAQDVIAELDASLSALPSKYKPSWTLREQLLLEGDASNVGNARFSQPLCCAVQILLVRLLKSVGLEFKSVVGHSSGEIACAYAAGFISATQAICIAYLRGLTSDLAASPNGSEGAMMAAGTSFEDAQQLCDLEVLSGRVRVAASNGPDSVTLSGDKDAILEAQAILEDESRFSRLLHVDKAYHSHHMLPCAAPYAEALRACGCDTPQAAPENAPIWLSSVYDGKVMRPKDLKAEYWVENLVSPVLFSQAVESAMIKTSPLHLVVEVGPHPALKNPCLNTIENCTTLKLPYATFMARKKNDADAFAAGIGYIWERFGSAALDIRGFYEQLSSNIPAGTLSKSLPTYPFDHSRSYRKESRITKAWLRGTTKPHLLLGKLSAHSTSSRMQWHSSIKPTDMDWIDGHALQGQTVFPGAGYVVMAMEAALHIAGDREVRLIEVLGLKIDKAVTFEDENSLVELNLTINAPSPKSEADQVVLDFTIDSCLAKESGLSTSASGQVVLSFGSASADALPHAQDEPPHLNKVIIDSFYSHLDGIGYGYTKEFRGITTMRRGDSKSRGTLNWPKLQDGDESLILHPATLDVAFQTFIGAYCAPRDRRLRSLLVPTHIDRIALNPRLAMEASEAGNAHFLSTTLEAGMFKVGGDIEVFAPETRATILHIEGLAFKPFSPPTAADDHLMFNEWTWGPLTPDELLDSEEHRANQRSKDVTILMERITYYYVRTFLEELTGEDREQAAPHYHWQINWCEHVLADAKEGQHYCYDSSWEKDTEDVILKIIQKNVYHPHVRLLQRVGENILSALREDKNAFDIMDHDGLLTEFYKETDSYGVAYQYFEQLVKQIGHRYQNMDILEIGAGTGGATRYALGQNGKLSFNSYTFTDISSAFFDQGRREFEEYQDKMDFQTLDVRRSPEDQDFAPHSYDLIIASNVLHATPNLEETLSNVRKLLKPGGQLVIIEVTHREHWRIGFIFGMFADWWAGVDEGRVLEPFVSMDKWDDLMKRTGFSGIESRTADPDRRIFPNSVFSTRAVNDEISRLSSPLSQPAKSSYPPVVIIGGNSPRTLKIVKQLVQLIPNRQANVLKTLVDVHEADIEPKSTFVILTEVDKPLFSGLDEDRFEAMQLIFDLASHVLWVTEDAWVEHPIQAMSLGLLRSLRLEYSDVEIQCLDIQDLQSLDTKFIAEQIHRLEDGSAWQENGILWTQEPELYLSNNRLMIPRLKSDVTKNNRLNSDRRSILAPVDPSRRTVSLDQVDGLPHLQAIGSYVASNTSDSKLLDVQVRFASAKAFRVDNAGYFHVVQGTSPTSGPILALTEVNASKVRIHPGRGTSLRDTADIDKCILPTVVAGLIAHTIVSETIPGTTVLILEPPNLWADALVQQAEELGVEIKFAGMKQSRDRNASHWIQLHEKETRRGLAKKLPSNVSAFYDLSSHPNMGHHIQDSLPPSCSFYNIGRLVQDRAILISPSNTQPVSLTLEQALHATGKPVTPAKISLVQASQLATFGRGLTIDDMVEWDTEEHIPVAIRPIDSGMLFEDGKTYLLVGLAGDLGRSIARWMVVHGARNVVLSSRSPKVEQQWLEDVKALGGNVMVLPMDVSDEISLDAGLAKIRKSMPPIAGVAFGPLVLQDILFKNMELEMMEMVLAPKVKGAYLLNDRLSRDKENPLDFFVMFSSFVMVSGNPGQAAYSAANAFTLALANKRRARGLAASTIDIGAVYGVGFIARAGREEEFDVVKFMFDSVSELELQALFGEAVVAGRSKGTDSVELVTGMPYMDPVDRDRIPYYNDPRLSWYKLAGRESNGGEATAAQGSVKDQLLKATTMDEVRAIITTGLGGKLRSALQLGLEDTVSLTTPLIDQGVDSLSAVTVGGWFSKNLSLDIPLLKVLGGASINDLVDEALDRLLPSTIPMIQGKEETEAVSGASLTAPGSVWSSTESRTPLTYNTTPALSSPTLGPQDDVKTGDGRLSFGQEHTWKLQQLPLEPTTFNSTVGMFMNGPVDINRLAASFNAALQRNDAFRMRFTEDSEGAGYPVQSVLRSPAVRFEAVQVADWAAAEEAFWAVHKHHYDPTKGDTLKIVDFAWSEVDHLLIFAYHQLVGDGWTTERLFVEAGSLYSGVSLPPAPSYLDFATRQRRQYEDGEMAIHIDYWKSLYATLPKTLPIMSVPQARIRGTPEFKLHEGSARLNPMIAIRIRDRSRKLKATPMQFYLAAYQVLLARLTGSSDISIGVADTNRQSEDDMATMGQFANFLPVRLGYSVNNTFGETLVAAKENMRNAILHSSVPYSVILDGLSLPTNTAEPPLFQAVFDYKQGQAESGSIGEAKIIDTLIRRAGTPYDVVLEMSDDPTKDPLITVKLQSSLYGPEDVKVVVDAYLSILSVFSRNPALRVDEGRLDQGHKAIANSKA